MMKAEVFFMTSSINMNNPKIKRNGHDKARHLEMKGIGESFESILLIARLICDATSLCSVSE